MNAFNQKSFNRYNIKVFTIFTYEKCFSVFMKFTDKAYFTFEKKKLQMLKKAFFYTTKVQLCPWLLTIILYEMDIGKS